MRGLVIVGMLAATLLPVGARAQLSDELTPSEYLGTIAMFTDMMGDGLQDFGEKTRIYGDDLTDDMKLAEAVAETGVFEAVYAAALDMDPPSGMESVHEAMLQALEPLAEAAPLMRKGLVEKDSEALQEATALMDVAVVEAREASDLIEAIKR